MLVMCGPQRGGEDECSPAWGPDRTTQICSQARVQRCSLWFKAHTNLMTLQCTVPWCHAAAMHGYDKTASRAACTSDTSGSVPTHVSSWRSNCNRVVHCPLCPP